MKASNVETGSPQPAPPVAVIVGAVGIRSAATPFDVQEETLAKRFFLARHLRW